jgi:hypothetical protein
MESVPDTSDSVHVAYVIKAMPEWRMTTTHIHTMMDWCDNVCEGFWNRAYHSWHVDAWQFNHAEDHAQFVITWADHVIDPVLVDID